MAFQHYFYSTGSNQAIKVILRTDEPDMMFISHCYHCSGITLDRLHSITWLLYTYLTHTLTRIQTTTCIGNLWGGSRMYSML